MKCEFCGGDLSLEAESCPHCGQLNKHAQQHIKDMKLYRREFESTKKGVYSATKKYTEVTVRMVIITVMVVLIVALGIIYSNIYSIHRDVQRSLASRREEEYSRILDDYLAEEDYRGFLVFCESKGISLYYENGEFDAYQRLADAVGCYFQVSEKVMKVALSTEEDTLDSDSLCYELNQFYAYCDPEKYTYYKGEDRAETWQALERMEENIKLMLQTYCNLTEEETDSLKELSEARRTVLIEERLEND